MVDIDINPGFEAKARKAHRRKQLSDIITQCETSMSDKIRLSPSITNEEVARLENISRTFLSCYFALKEQVEKKRIFKRENGKGSDLANAYCLYSASKAVMNKINDESIAKLRTYGQTPNQPSIDYADLNNSTDYELLHSIYSRLSGVKTGNNAAVLKYSYFNFFDTIRDKARNYIGANMHPDTRDELNSIKIYKTGLSFNEIPPPQKKEFTNEGDKNKAPSANVENLPTEVPNFPEPRPDITLDKVVGNTELIIPVKAAMIKVLKFDHKLNFNPFYHNGYSFNDAFLIYGDPGVGKNFTVDALLNHFKAKAREHKIAVEFADLSSGIHSMYRDRSAQIFQRYVQLENEAMNAWFNMIDEADGVFTTNEHGEMCEESKKLLREMKASISNGVRGKSLVLFLSNYAEKFEAALKNRFIPIRAEGAKVPEEYARLVRQELGPNSQYLDNKELYNLGKIFYDFRVQLEKKGNKKSNAKEDEMNFSLSGRDIKQICAPFTSGNDEIIVENEDLILGASTEKVLRIIPELCIKPTYDKLVDAIEKHIYERNQACAETTARYNK